MKKVIKIIFLILILSVTLEAQLVIKNPKYGFRSGGSFEIQKIEITDDATLLYFHTSFNPGAWILIPDETYIQVVGNEEKLFITDSEEILVNERFIMPASGETDYTLIFPKIDTSTYRIDYGEANDGGTWFIYNIELKQEKGKSVVPKKLLGNWFRKEGGVWELSLLDSVAIYKSKKWNYGKVELNDGKGSIELVNKKDRINLFIEKNKNGSLQFGETPNDGALYCNDISKVSIKNSIIDEPYKEPIFSLDSALFSGYFKGFTERIGIKNLTIQIPDIISSEQTSVSVKISDDGYFSVKLPLYYPNTIYIQSKVYDGSVFLEPGKDLFQMVDANNTLYMGELAKINTDLEMIKDIGIDYYYSKIKSKILDITRDEYKSLCQELQKNEIAKLDSVMNSGNICAKAYQIRKYDIEYYYPALMMLYKMTYEFAYRDKNNIPSTQRILPIKIDALSADYLDFITNEITNNSLAVISSGYSSFINDLKHQEILREQPLDYPIIEIANDLSATGYSFTNEENELLKNLEEIKTLKEIAEPKEFNDNYGNERKKFLREYYPVLIGLYKKLEDRSAAFESIEKYLIENGVELTSDEEELIKALKIHDSTKTMLKVREIQRSNREMTKEFYTKHRDFTSRWFTERQSKAHKEKLQTILGIKPGFAADIMTAQDYCSGIVAQMTPVSEEKLKAIQQEISSPFIAEYVGYCNERTIAKIDANKAKTGYVVNETPKTEADILFDSLMVKYRGKVVYVDFWATWCAPCRSGIEQIKPLKEEMANEDVEFVYITNYTSPKNTWGNMIPNIKGEHYRLTSDEWSVLSAKFNIVGIPHYVLVGKKGEIIDSNLDHMGNEALKTKLRKYINE